MDSQKQGPSPIYGRLGSTISRVPVKPEYSAEDLAEAGFDPARDLGRAGAYPFTRGRTKDGYSDHLWDMATYSGISSPEETNARFRHIVANSEPGRRNTLAIALDLPSQVGLDPDHPMAEGEVGRSGVSVASLRDVEALYDGIPLERVRMATVSNGMGNVAASWFLALAIRRGTDIQQAVANLQNDPLKEFTGRGTFIYPVEGHMRLTLDTVEHCIKELPHWRPISVCGSQLRWGGATAVEEVAFAIAHTEAYLDGLLDRGLDVREILPLFEFHMVADSDILEEASKFRALRRCWSERMARRYGLLESEVICPSVQIYTAGYTLTAQEPLNNIVRIALQVAAAALGGVDYVATCSFDEAIATPTMQALEVALRTQQIVAYESGLAAVADPLGGSYYVEWLTTELSRRVQGLLEDIYAAGGPVAAIASGWTNRLMADLAYTWQEEVERQDRIVVGVNRFAKDETEAPMEAQRVADDLEERRRVQVAELRRERSGRQVSRALSELAAVTKKGGNTLPATIEAVLAYATIQEICDVFRAEFGEYQGHDAL